MSNLETRIKALKTKAEDKAKAEKAVKDKAAADYASLKTDKDRLAFMARHLGLTQEE
jgi:non-ribosomal peptide synthetase component E (peptide arylation enzyme)